MFESKDWGMETLLINEQFVSQFKYWREGHIQSGMRFRNGLFEHAAAFGHHQRHQAFDLAERLAGLGKEVIITASPNRYMIWVNLRSATGALDLDRLGASAAQTNFARSSHELMLAEVLSA